ncbi:hypothetical protein V490_07587 [Pseudogymnoascus sp. VKM F-3557]|nr:hypothetical protein V490_07587 [Pseudogymnoascus sp. VKM F-3557]
MAYDTKQPQFTLFNSNEPQFAGDSDGSEAGECERDYGDPMEGRFEQEGDGEDHNLTKPLATMTIKSEAHTAPTFPSRPIFKDGVSFKKREWTFEFTHLPLPLPLPSTTGEEEDKADAGSELGSSCEESETEEEKTDSVPLDKDKIKSSDEFEAISRRAIERFDEIFEKYKGGETGRGDEDDEVASGDEI